jgi:hypothetical protein
MVWFSLGPAAAVGCGGPVRSFALAAFFDIRKGKGDVGRDHVPRVGAGSCPNSGTKRCEDRDDVLNQAQLRDRHGRPRDAPTTADAPDGVGVAGCAASTDRT